MGDRDDRLEKAGKASKRDTDELVELPKWVKRAIPNAKPKPKPRTLAERLREAGTDHIDLVEIEQEIAEDVERLRPTT